MRHNASGNDRLDFAILLGDEKASKELEGNIVAIVSSRFSC